MPRKHYTHLLPESAELIASFINSVPYRYSMLDYDIKVGFGRDPGDQFDDATRTTAIQLSKRRIDCVGFSADRIDIIEVTPKAGLTALGQMVAYPMLYDAAFPQERPIFAVLVAYEFAPDIQVIFDTLKIEYNLMPRPAPVTDQIARHHHDIYYYQFYPPEQPNHSQNYSLYIFPEGFRRFTGSPVIKTRTTSRPRREREQQRDESRSMP